MTPLLALFFSQNPVDLIVLLGLGVLLFGRKLPEVGRYIGKGIVEFKRGLKGLEDDVDGSYDRTEPKLEPPRPPQRLTATSPKFEDDAGAVTTPPKE